MQNYYSFISAGEGDNLPMDTFVKTPKDKALLI